MSEGRNILGIEFGTSFGSYEDTMFLWVFFLLFVNFKSFN